MEDTVTATELREIEDAHLLRQEQEARQELFQLRLQLSTGKSVNNSRFKQLRKEIARIRTVLHERQGA